MSEQSIFPFDNFEYTKISFVKFCDEFNKMLASMRMDKNLAGFQNYFESEVEWLLSPSSSPEEDVFEFAAIYEDFLQCEFGDGLGDLLLPNGIIDIYSQIEIIDRVPIPWLTVGIFNDELDATRKELLVCKDGDSNHYWKLGESKTPSSNNIPTEFRLIADKLRRSLGLMNI